MGRRQASAAAGAQAQAGAVEEDADPLGDIAEMLKVEFGDETTDEQLKAAVIAAINTL
ncbi:MAG: hypothetical protein KAQ96_09765 [Thermoplasmata archaeon]|nr:hypothetical protein [Thermoplasmata archaeon]